MKNIVFNGSCTAIITPFKNGEVDFDSFRKLIAHQIENGTDAIAVLGTTGEPATLSEDEREKIIVFAKSSIAGRAKLIVGTGANCTRKAVENSQNAERLGADALLIVTPYYNKCTQNGLILHYTEISKSVNIPIIVYNVPTRTGVNILPETAVKLSEIEKVCGIKEASGDIAQIMLLCRSLNGKMAVYSGEDSHNFIFLSLGGLGVISVVGNILPKEIKLLTKFVQNGQFVEARALHEKLLSINKNIFIEVNPIPVKFACSEMGLCENELRLPLTPLEKIHEEIIKRNLEEF
ncbi:MAG: 4-hydroxy-tetrahydrodipicolinate synthase [Clostridia bacterium]|nr:4-hydroxy-tetrahydrodipicolinate synthase [Clostridia bacterium]